MTDDNLILEEKKYLVEVLGKKLIDSNERDDSQNWSESGYLRLTKKYWPEEFKDNTKKHVHHIDFDRTNNVVSNLVVLTPSEHKQIHFLFDPKAEETRKKLCEVKEGTKLSEETRKKMSTTRRKLPPFKGKHHTKETKQKISVLFKGKHRVLIDGKYRWCE